MKVARQFEARHKTTNLHYLYKIFETWTQWISGIERKKFFAYAETHNPWNIYKNKYCKIQGAPTFMLVYKYWITLTLTNRMSCFDLVWKSQFRTTLNMIRWPPKQSTEIVTNYIENRIQLIWLCISFHKWVEKYWKVSGFNKTARMTHCEPNLAQLCSVYCSRLNLISFI